MNRPGRMLSRVNTVFNHLKARPMSSFNYPKLPQVTLNLEKAEAEVIVPGYSYGDLDRMGNVGSGRVGWMVEQVQVSAVCHPMPPSGVNFDKILPNHLDFLVAAEHKLTEDFYDKDHHMQPLRASYKIANMGKSYYLEYYKFMSTSTGRVIQESFYHNVLVDRNTHKPSPIPESFRQKMAMITCTLDHPKVQPFPKPTKTHTQAHTLQYKVQWSNTDPYYHSNQSEYMRYIKDVIAELSLARRLTHLKGDLAQYKVKGWRQVYQGETAPGDLLDIHVWEQEEDPPRVVRCHIEKAGQVVHQCVVEFGDKL